MENYVITFNDIHNKDSLMYEYQNIQGKNAKDALKKTFNRDFERLTGDEGRYADVIIVKGHFDNNTNRMHVNNRYVQLCFRVIQR